MLNVVVFGPLFGEVGHLPLDHAWVDPVAAERPATPGPVRDHAGVERRQAVRRGEAAVRFPGGRARHG